MISRRKFVGLLSAVPLVGNTLTAKSQHSPLPPASESTEKAWLRFASDLADAIADLDDDEFLIVETKKNCYYVQFSAQGKLGIRAEAVSNEFLDDTNKLSEQACATLKKLGWNAPTHAPDDPKNYVPDGSPNYFLDADAPVPYSPVASLAVDTLRGVYRARHPGELQYKAFANGGVDIRFPSLRIARER